MGQSKDDRRTALGRVDADPNAEPEPGTQDDRARNRTRPQPEPRREGPGCVGRHDRPRADRDAAGTASGRNPRGDSRPLDQPAQRRRQSQSILLARIPTRSRNRSGSHRRRHADQPADPRARPGLLRHQLADAGTRQLRRVQQGTVLRQNGDFSTAGSYTLYYKNTLPTPIAEFGIGNYGYGNSRCRTRPKSARAICSMPFSSITTTARSSGPTSTRSSTAFFAGAARRRIPISTLRRWAITARFSRPIRSRSAGRRRRRSARTDTIDPFDGGTTYRYALSSQSQHIDPHGTTHAYGVRLRQYLDLYSDFTYDLDDATDYYNVTRNPVTCTLGYTTCAPGPQHVTAYMSYCPANNVPGAAHARRTRSPRCVHVFVRRPARTDKTNASSRASTHRARSIRAGISPRRSASGCATTTSPRVGLFLVHDDVPYPDGTLSLAHVVERDSYAWVQTLCGSVRSCGSRPACAHDYYNFNVAG